LSAGIVAEIPPRAGRIEDLKNQYSIVNRQYSILLASDQ